MAERDAGGGPADRRVLPLAEAVREALALHNAGRLAEATALYQGMLDKPRAQAFAAHQLGLIAAGAGDLLVAIRRMSEAIAANPRMVEAYSNLGMFLWDYGEVERAADAFHAALAIDPKDIRVRCNLLQCLLYLPNLDPEQRFAWHLAVGAQHEPPPDGVLPPPPNDRDPERRLRIGILSPDLHGHASSFNFMSPFHHRDPAAVHLTGYSLVARPDATTADFQARSDQWRDVAALSDRAIAEQIRADAIDLLVVCCVRFEGNRPLAVTYRPAPIQVSFLDCATSGLRSFDYFVSDAQASPPAGSTERFVEQIVRMPLVWNRPPPTDYPPVGPLPALANGYVTFGSLNRPNKINAAVIALWAALLRAVPTARLALKYRNRFAEPMLRARVLAAFVAHGIAPERLVFLPGEMGYYAAYNHVDIVLDTFPFPGVTTTFDALAMSVPVVARCGDSFLLGLCATILAAVGLPDLIARSDAEFLRIAAHLAGDLDRLAALRAGLRAQVSASPLCDGPAHARALEQLWRRLWREWCAKPA
jgi:predicted O-linked N-acetylglucosamine transferase (SPINDLY family)